MDLGTFETLLVEQDGDALVVTVNRPSAMNALAGQVIADLEALTVAVESQVGPRWWVRARHGLRLDLCLRERQVRPA